MIILLRTAAGFLFDNPLGRLAGGVALVLALVSGFAWQQRNIGAAGAVAEIKKNGDRNAEKADLARRAVERLPADRLRDRYFRD